MIFDKWTAAAWAQGRVCAAVMAGSLGRDQASAEVCS